MAAMAANGEAGLDAAGDAGRNSAATSGSWKNDCRSAGLMEVSMAARAGCIVRYLVVLELCLRTNAQRFASKGLHLKSFPATGNTFEKI